MRGRWDVFVCTGCGECTGRHAACDAVREKTPVVPCDDAAVERAALAIAQEAGHASTASYARRLAAAALRAAGEDPS
jgi:hypothetical protein